MIVQITESQKYLRNDNQMNLGKCYIIVQAGGPQISPIRDSMFSIRDTKWCFRVGEKRRGQRLGGLGRTDTNPIDIGTSNDHSHLIAGQSSSSNSEDQPYLTHSSRRLSLQYVWWKEVAVAGMQHMLSTCAKRRSTSLAQPTSLAAHFSVLPCQPLCLGKKILLKEVAREEPCAH